MSDEKTFTLAEVQAMRDEWVMQQKDREIEMLKQQVSAQPAAPAEQPRPPPAAAPSAPSKIEDHRRAGILNIFALPEATLSQFTPQELRVKFEEILEYGRQISGAPPLPSPDRPRNEPPNFGRKR